ncbi:MAG: hypothetical protein WCW14_01725, partial [Candidatus Paceibacterota bacterium]
CPLVNPPAGGIFYYEGPFRLATNLTEVVMEDSSVPLCGRQWREFLVPAGFLSRRTPSTHLPT